MGSKLMIEKKAPSSAVLVDSEVVDTVELVDRLGAIAQRKEAISVEITKKTAKLREELGYLAQEENAAHEALLAAFAPKDQEAEASIEGKQFVARISKVPRGRVIFDKYKLWSALEKAQKGLAQTLAMFKLGDVDKYVAEAQQEEFLKWEYSYLGDAARRVTVKEKKK